MGLNDKKLQLEDLEGFHMLSGVDINDESICLEYKNSFENCQAIRFQLDGETYAAIEDPEDGYRSMLKELVISHEPIKNTFGPVGIVANMDLDSDKEIIRFFHYKTGKLILLIGTDYSDAYYPIFMYEFHPENI